jgi:hypothetical protein
MIYTKSQINNNEFILFIFTIAFIILSPKEYNICFTTVERSSDGNIPNLPASKATGVLPEVIAQGCDITFHCCQYFG